MEQVTVVPKMVAKILVTAAVAVVIMPFYFASFILHYSRWRDGWVERSCDTVGEPLIDFINRLWD